MIPLVDEIMLTLGGRAVGIRRGFCERYAEIG